MRRIPGKLSPEDEAFVEAVRRELERLKAEKGLPSQDEQDVADLSTFLPNEAHAARTHDHHRGGGAW